MRKILVLNPFGTNKYNRDIKKIIDPIKLEDTVFEVSNLARGPAHLDFCTYVSLVAPDIVETIYQAEKQGYDGVFVACGGEPGVRVAREVVDIPVVGALIPTVLIAHQLGARFSIVYNSKNDIYNSWDILSSYGVTSKCVSIESVDLSLEAMVQSPEIVDDKVINISKVVYNKGAEVIVLACTIVAAFFSGRVPDELSKIEYLNCNLCAFKYLEMLIELQKKVGVKVSRVGYYSNPKDFNEEEFKLFRSYYGYK
jgi:allantoin racemase